MKYAYVFTREEVQTLLRDKRVCSECGLDLGRPGLGFVAEMICHVPELCPLVGSLSGEAGRAE